MNSTLSSIEAENAAYRVCIIVDHPDRDLHGTILVARNLLDHGVDVYLTPMYLKWEILLLTPHVVVLNYIRNANIDFVKACLKSGIRVVLSDTEGTGIKQLMVNAKDVLKYADRWCLWGYSQYRLFLENFPEAGNMLVVTGAPRLDFLAKKWRGAITPIPRRSQPMVLINTNFPIYQPRFQSRDVERAALIKTGEISGDEADRLIAEVATAHAAMIDAVGRAAAKFPNLDFVIRPHPFENIEPYQRALASRPNVQILNSGNVHEYLKACDVLLHFHCTTSLEAAMMDKPTILLGTVPSKLFPMGTVPMIEDDSLVVKNLDQLFGLLEMLSTEGRIQVGRDGIRRRSEIFHELFRSNDGDNSRLVADAVADVVKTMSAKLTVRQGPVEDVKRLALATWGITSRWRWISISKLAIFAMLGGARVYALKRLLKPGSQSSQKLFTADQIAAIWLRIDEIDGGRYKGVVEIEPATHATTLPVRLESIRIRTMTTKSG